ncbi:hypothetical protein HAX54_032893 [Datura stramonium]|uniref:Uncharacterized protein n=1 Tax=Datura stramonium TaxID=4076 RepID=A0ABS8RLJ0_DATST|nr:hypothetical protein [Datura stramonium]
MSESIDDVVQSTFPLLEMGTNSTFYTQYCQAGLGSSHAESGGMSLDIPAPGHTTTPSQITSLNSDSGDHLEKIIQLVNSDAIELEDSPDGEPLHSGLESGGWEEFMQFLNSDAIEFEESPHGKAYGSFPIPIHTIHGFRKCAH